MINILKTFLLCDNMVSDERHYVPVYQIDIGILYNVSIRWKKKVNNFSAS